MVFDALNEISFGKSQSFVTLIGQLKKYHLNMSCTDSETGKSESRWPSGQKKMSQFIGTTLARKKLYPLALFTVRFRISLVFASSRFFICRRRDTACYYFNCGLNMRRQQSRTAWCTGFWWPFDVVLDSCTIHSGSTNINPCVRHCPE